MTCAVGKSASGNPENTPVDNDDNYYTRINNILYQTHADQSAELAVTETTA